MKQNKQKNTYTVSVYAPDKQSYECHHCTLPSSMCITLYGVLCQYSEVKYEEVFVNGKCEDTSFHLRSGDAVSIYTKKEENREDFLKRMKKKELLESARHFESQLKETQRLADGHLYNLTGVLQQLQELARNESD